MHRRDFVTLLGATAVLLVLWGSAACAQSDRSSDQNPTTGRRSDVVPADLFVDDDNAGTEDGTAVHPFRTVQQAIDAAANHGVIAVAGGAYPENVRIQEKSVRLYGGYVGGTAAGYARGTAGNFTERDLVADPSHLRGDGEDSVVTLFAAGDSIVDGFLITGGARSAQAAPAWVGGGFYVHDGSPTISNNVIENNHTCPPVPQEEEKLGGGIYSTGASLTVLDNTIRNNIAGRGAGIAADGPKLVIRGNTVVGNIGVSDHGGGIYIFSPDAEISHNRVENNEIGRALQYGWGGGITVVNVGGKYRFSHNVFTGNFAPSVGSAIFVDEGATAFLDHDLLYANACNPGGNGGVPAIYVDGGADGGSTLRINHITVADHACEPAVSGGAVSVTGESRVNITNSIFWNNGGDDVEVDETSKATVTYSLTQEAIKGTGNLSVDPLFADAARHDYRLRSRAGRWSSTADGNSSGWVHDSQYSPALDAADPTSPFKLEPAPNGNRANLGFDGNTAQASRSLAR